MWVCICTYSPSTANSPQMCMCVLDSFTRMGFFLLLRKDVMMMIENLNKFLAKNSNALNPYKNIFLIHKRYTGSLYSSFIILVRLLSHMFTENKQHTTSYTLTFNKKKYILFYIKFSTMLIFLCFVLYFM